MKTCFITDRTKKAIEHFGENNLSLFGQYDETVIDVMFEEVDIPATWEIYRFHAVVKQKSHIIEVCWLDYNLPVEVVFLLQWLPAKIAHGKLWELSSRELPLVTNLSKGHIIDIPKNRMEIYETLGIIETSACNVDLCIHSEWPSEEERKNSTDRFPEVFA